MNVIVDGLIVSYTKSGRGPLIVMLHGWGDSLQTFNKITDKLSSTFEVVRVDLPGFGNSQMPSEPYDLNKYAEFVRDFLVKIDKTKVFTLVGHSNGGAIAIKITANEYLKPEKLILLASSGIRSEYKSRKKITRIAVKLLKQPTKLLPSSIQDKLAKKVYKLVGSDMFVAEGMQETFKKVVSEDLVEESSKIRQETLLLYGSNDEATPARYGTKFHENIKNSEIFIINGADHFLHQNHEDEVLNHITKFLRNKK